MKKAFILALALVLLVLVIIGTLIYIGTKRQHDAVPTGTPPKAEEPKGRMVPAGAKEYRNNPYHFSILYPESMDTTDFAEAGGARTVTFEDGEGHSLQIYVTPYAEKTITPERLRRDIPSEVVGPQTPLAVGGVQATAFNSSHPLVGDTREIWFIRGGYLYEATTLRAEAPLLEDVLKTWEFI